MRGRAVAAVVALMAVLAPVPLAQAKKDKPVGGPADFVVLSGEGNRLNAYDGRTGTRQTVIQSADDAETHGGLGGGQEPGGEPSAEGEEIGLDINAQLCVHEFGGKRYFIAGEDTGQTGEGSPGWGWFELRGDEVGELSAVEHGKLIPAWAQPDGQENYGCGFLPSGDLLLSDVGSQLPHEDANGQLHLWYLDPATGFDDPTFVDVSGGVFGGIDNRTDGVATGQRYCMIDRSIGTAGGVMVHDGWAYVASNRPGPNGPGGVYRYEIADFPARGTGCNGLGETTDLVDAGVVTRELWLPSDAFVLTPSAVVASGRSVEGHPTFFVSSVFTGVVAEYVDTGAARVHLRNVVEPPGGAPIGQADDLNRPFDEGGFPRPNDAGTPYGLVMGPDRSLWYADLGIQGPGPADGKGSVQRVTFDSGWNVRDHLVADEGLDFPDGMGMVSFGPDRPERTDGDLPERGDPKASSEVECEWAMYGHGAARDFALPDRCVSPIRSTSAPTLVPKWKVETDKTVTASPAVVGGTVYVGDWSGTMYAVDAESGAVQWTFDVEDAPGAAFGPIVSSAAVAEVRVAQGLQHQRLVVFGAGPRLYALNGSTGEPEWVFTLDERSPTFVEIESSPVVWKGVVYVGIGNHNHGGTGVPGGLVALDAATGTELWRFEPEQGADEGCGTVWSSPTVEGGKRPLVYAATANCTRRGWTWTRHVEAVTALDARTGEPVWSFQPHLRNHKDWDFGSTPNLFTDPETGRRVLGAANKDGAYYALDPQTGALLWSRKLVRPGDVNDNFSVGGFLGSTGAKDGVVFGGSAIGGPPYYHALDATDGALKWHGAQAPSYAASAAVNDVVLSAALDGVIRAYHAETGAVLWSSPLLGPGSSGPAVVGDSVYVVSGTSSSDACAKELPVNEQCLALFDQVLGGMGGIEAFELAVPPPALPDVPEVRRRVPEVRL